MAVKTSDTVVCLSDFTNDGLLHNVPLDAKKKTAIRIDGLATDDIKKLDMKIVGNNLEISYDGKKLLVSNYTSLKYIKTEYQKIEKKEYYDLFNIIENNVVNNTNSITYNLKKLTVSGSNYNDKIDLSLSCYTPIGLKNIKKNKGIIFDGKQGSDSLVGTDYNDIFKGGNGNDEITGGKGADTITGGTGKNIINYTKGDGNDIINLTKGENFTLSLNGVTDIDNINFEFINKNKDLKIYTDRKNSKEFIILKNIVAKNITNNGITKKKIIDTSSVEVLINGKTYDLRECLYSINAKKNYTGSWLNEKIDASNYIAFDKNGNQLFNNKKGLKLKGNNGNDVIIGSQYNDTIYAGQDKNILIGNNGDDKLYSGKTTNSETLFIFNQGNDKDIITMGKGNDSIVLNSVLQESVCLKRENNDLIINYGTENDEIIIKNYFNAKYKSLNTIYFADNYDYINDKNINIVKTGEINLDEIFINSGEYKYDKNSRINYQLLKGSEKNNLICSSKKYDVIYAEGGNDNIYVYSKIANVYGDSGNDSYNISNLKNTTKLTDDSGFDTININNSLSKSIILFNVSVDNKFSTLVDNDLFILNSSSLSKLKKDITKITKSGVHILNYFNNKEIEKINFKDNCILPNNIYKIKNAVCDWLYKNNYANSFEAIQQCSSSKINELIAIYKSINNDNLNITEQIQTDTYIVGKNDGNFIVYAGIGVNNIEFKDEEKISDLNFSSVGKDLIIKYNNGKNTVTLKDFVLSIHSIDYIIVNNTKYNIYESNLYGESPLFINSPSYKEFFGGYENDTLTGNGSSHIFYGGFGDDTIYAGNDRMVSSSNDGLEYGGYSDETVYGGAGNDVIYCAGGFDSVENEVYAGEGNDKIFGGRGLDYILGDAGNDLIKGRAGNDVLIGGEGNDTIYGDTNSSIYDDTGSDILSGGNGNNYLDGGNGSDIYILLNDGVFKTTNEQSTINDTGTSGNDSLFVFTESEKINIWFDYNKDDKFTFSIKELDENTDNNAIVSGVEEIFSTDGTYTLKYDYKNESLKYQVLNWLTLNSFSDVTSAMENASTEQQNELLAIFNDSALWQETALISE